VYNCTYNMVFYWLVWFSSAFDPVLSSKQYTNHYYILVVSSCFYITIVHWFKKYGLFCLKTRQCRTCTNNTFGMSNVRIMTYYREKKSPLKPTTLRTLSYCSLHPPKARNYYTGGRSLEFLHWCTVKDFWCACF